MPDDELEQPRGRRGRLLHGTLEGAGEVPNAKVHLEKLHVVLQPLERPPRGHERTPLQPRSRVAAVVHRAGTPDAHFAYFQVHVEAPSSLRTRAPLSTSGSKLVALTATVP